jgi:hypothetical protein
VDAGFQDVTVKNFQSRFLGGLRGEWRGFEWETALLYSEAEAEDLSPNINMTALQAQLALSTPDAYNPFSGGCIATTSVGDCSPSSQAAIDAITFEMRRFSRTTLALADFKMSRTDLFELPAGPVGLQLDGVRVAFGDVEFTAVVVKLADVDIALGLQSGVDDHEIVVDAHHLGGDDFAGAHFLEGERLLEERSEAFGGGGGGCCSAQLIFQGDRSRCCTGQAGYSKPGNLRSGERRC